MKKDIILAGVGGQGILSIATVIGYAAIESGLSLKQSEVHGMSQRGGDVSSNLRISSKEIYSDLIPFGSADVIISVEPMESLRYLPYLSKDGWLITNSTPFVNIDNYPELEEVKSEIDKLQNSLFIEGDKIAKENKNARGMNMVMLGAASNYLDIPFEKLEEGIKFIFGRKGEDVVEANLRALRAGRDCAK
ncbi:MAG: indolepyruvate oxidoreductase [Candidatus Cloacimonadota bacterium]|nr:MAG: indolepyruvate oxidoreductase [Candidatus Cloacimonadota bacterium]PIE78597.1 MAG: indolepyruvate oxidoreductase [Candidatus Delongbacteria bacterium]